MISIKYLCAVYLYGVRCANLVFLASSIKYWLSVLLLDWYWLPHLIICILLVARLPGTPRACALAPPLHPRPSYAYLYPVPRIVAYLYVWKL
jgi:hypothetical protein